MILNFLLISVIGEYHVKLEAQTLKTDSHDIILLVLFLVSKQCWSIWLTFEQHQISENRFVQLRSIIKKLVSFS